MNIIEIKIVDFENGGYAASCKFEGQVFGSFKTAKSKSEIESIMKLRMYSQIYDAYKRGLCRKWDKYSDRFVFKYSKYGADIMQGLFAPTPMPQEKRLYELIETRDENGVLQCSIRKHDSELLTESEVKAKLFSGDK